MSICYNCYLIGFLSCDCPKPEPEESLAWIQSPNSLRSYPEEFERALREYAERQEEMKR